MEARLPARIDADSRRGHETMVRRRFWTKFRRTVGKIPFSADLLTAYYAATDSTTPLYVKAVLMWALAYFVIPTDLIPDFIAGFGFTDDAGVLAAAISAVRSHIKPAHRERAQALLRTEAEASPHPLEPEQD